MTSGFVPDDKIRQIAEAYAIDCLDFARDHFHIKLDWSDASVQHIESMLERFHAEYASAKPSEETLGNFMKLFGSYVGEVFRRDHGATWGMITLASSSFPGMKANNDGATFWPWGRVQNRITNGAEDDVWHYYQILVADHGGNAAAVSPAPAPESPPKASWWWSAVRIVLLVAVLGCMAFLVVAPTLAIPAATSPSRRVVREQPSPSGAHMATVVEVSGGGAAGYRYEVVVLRSRGSTQDVEVAARLYDVTLQWLDDDHLEVAYGSGSPGREAVDGVAIRYHPNPR